MSFVAGDASKSARFAILTLDRGALPAAAQVTHLVGLPEALLFGIIQLQQKIRRTHTIAR